MSSQGYKDNNFKPHNLFQTCGITITPDLGHGIFSNIHDQIFLSDSTTITAAKPAAVVALTGWKPNRRWPQKWGPLTRPIRSVNFLRKILKFSSKGFERSSLFVLVCMSVGVKYNTSYKQGGVPACMYQQHLQTCSSNAVILTVMVMCLGNVSEHWATV